MLRLSCLLLLLAVLVSCGPRPSVPAKSQVRQWHLLEGALKAGWQQAGIPEEARIRVEGDELLLPAGLPMTGAKWGLWTADMPATSYQISYEAQKQEGEDAFGMVTFPVGSHRSHVTFVLGGWGGTVTGFSSIDFKDANENQTRAEQRFEFSRWYQVKIEVTPEVLKAWIDGRIVANASIKGRQVGLRPGFIDHCLPFGFASYATSGRIRKVEIRELEAGKGP